MYIFAHALCVFVYMWRWRCSRWNDATQRDLPNKQTTWNVFCFFACWCCKNTRTLDRLWQHRRLHNRKKAPLFGGGAVLARADKRITQSKHKFDDGQSRAVCVCVCLWMSGCMVFAFCIPFKISTICVKIRVTYAHFLHMDLTIFTLRSCFTKTVILLGLCFLWEIYSSQSVN